MYLNSRPCFVLECGTVYLKCTYVKKQLKMFGKTEKLSEFQVRFLCLFTSHCEQKKVRIRYFYIFLSLSY